MDCSCLSLISAYWLLEALAPKYTRRLRLIAAYRRLKSATSDSKRTTASPLSRGRTIKRGAHTSTQSTVSTRPSLQVLRGPQDRCRRTGARLNNFSIYGLPLSGFHSSTALADTHIHPSSHHGTYGLRHRSIQSNEMGVSQPTYLPPYRNTVLPASGLLQVHLLQDGGARPDPRPRPRRQDGPSPCACMMEQGCVCVNVNEGDGSIDCFYTCNCRRCWSSPRASSARSRACPQTRSRPPWGSTVRG